MGSHRVYRERNYAFGQQLLTLRTRAALTQIALAEHIGVNRRSVQNWETGESYPKAETLHRLIALFLAQGVFTEGQETEEATQLWELASQTAPHSLGAFDAASFARLLSERASAPEMLARTPPTPLASEGALEQVLPEGLVTFLATDIEGSTLRWERAPQAMQQALTRHHAILQQLTKLYGGQVLHTAGDSFICVFADASAALQSGLALQRALLAEPWPEAVAPLRIRMAVHSGAATAQGEGYVAEPTLNRLSRVLGLSQGGQIVLTQATVDLIGARWPEGVRRRDLGVQQLRDVTVPLQLWQVLAPGLPVDVPQLGGIDDRPTTTAGRSTAPYAPVVVNSARSLIDWGEAIDVPALYGRDAELATLATWALADRCRLIALLGLGGIGKTSLALAFARQATQQFDVVIFRSLRNAPPIGELLDGLIHTISAQQTVPPERDADKITQLITLLRARRCLLILDNAETIMQEAAQAGLFRAGYTDYGMLLTRLGETQHQSCLLLTSREKPSELGRLEGRSSPVRTLALRGLDQSACLAVLSDRELSGAEADWATLAQMYGGNPLALKLVSEPIREIFGGDIAAFLLQGDAFFNGVGRLLDAQFTRSTPLEQALLLWLAIARDLAPLDALLADLAGTAGQREALQGLESLRRRYLVERAEGRPAFTLQPVVLEYLTARLVEAAAAELIDGRFELLCSHALLQARAREYVRQSQARLLVAPILARLRQQYRTDEAAALLLLERVAELRALPPQQQRYGGGNLANLLAQLRGELREVDLSGLALWQPFFAGVQMQGADLRGARLDGAVFSELMDPVFDVAVSPDGQYLAAATSQGELRIWRAADLVQVATCAGHTAQVWAIAFHPGPLSGPSLRLPLSLSKGRDSSGEGGAVLASGSFDGTVRLWAVPEGTGLGALVGHQGYVWDVAWRPDGAALASAGEDGTVRLWDVAAAAQLAALASKDAGATYAVAWHPEGIVLASGHADGSIRVWAAADPPGPAQPRVEHAERYRSLTAVHHSPAQPQERSVLRGHSGPIWALAWSPDGATLASCGADATIRLWGEQLQERAVLRGHTRLILGLSWHPNGWLLASAGADHSVRLWDSANARAHAVLDGHSNSVAGVAFSPDGAALASSGEDQTVRVWELPDGQPRATLVGYSQWTFAVAWSTDGWLVSAGNDRVVQIWEIIAADNAGSLGARLRASLAGHTSSTFCLAFSPDGRQLASCALDGTVRLWDLEAGRAVLELHGHGGFVATVAWSADGKMLASAGDDRAINIWDASSGARLRTLEGHADTIWSLAWHPRAGPAWLASAGGDHAIIIWDAASGARLRTLTGHTSFVRCVSWHPGGRLLASCSADGSVRLWDAASGAALATLQRHTNDVRAVAWHPGGTLLASAGEDRTIRLWEVQIGSADSSDPNPTLHSFANHVAERVVLHSDTGQVRAVAWSPDGALLASCGEGGWIALWDGAAALEGGGASAKLARFRGDRPYEQMRIGGAVGLTEAQRATLRALGAVED
jgi:WD40 repeat protein/class 3 adenylate cyclase/DNA-binding XRE family transcriptional regulator